MTRKTATLVDDLHPDWLPTQAPWKIAPCSYATVSDKFVQFYTGLPNAAILKAVYEFVAPKESSLLSKLTPFDADSSQA